MPRRTAAKAEDRTASREADFERAQQSMRVVSLAPGEESGVMEAHFLLEPADAIQIVLLPEPVADGRIGGGDFIEAVGKGFYIQAGAADHDDDGMFTKYLRRPLEGQFFENGGVDLFADGMGTNEIMMNGVKLSC